LPTIFFRLYPNLADFGGSLTVDRVLVDGQEIEVRYAQGMYLLEVGLPEPLAPNSTTTITIAFVTRAPLNAAYMYGAFNKQGGVLALASSYPLVAIVRAGQWEIEVPDGRGDFVNSETALYDLTLRVPSDWQAIATGSEISRTEQDGQ